MIKEKYTPPLSSHDYFTRSILPSEISAQRRVVTGSEPFERHDNRTELLLVREGSGRLIAGAEEFRAARGDIFCLCPHHFHRLIAAPGEELALTQCHVNSGSFLYIASCPYYHPSSALIPYFPLQVRLSEAATLDVSSMLDRIIGEKKANSQMSFYMIVRIIGYMERYAKEPKGQR